MEHVSTIINFAGKEKTARVEYSYRKSKYSELMATVYVNNELVHVFEKLPHTRTNNPSKSQAKEILSKAIKEAKLPQKKTRTVLIEKTKKL